jgi:hypothetical protein
VHAAVLELPSGLSWTAHRGETNPPLGWYSAGFGRKQPAVTLLGNGFAGGETTVMTTRIHFGR